MFWFDAHLDLAYLAVNGRDMEAPLDVEAGPHSPAAVTLRSLQDGAVAMALGTIFTERDGSGPEGYPGGDVERAFAVGRAQLEVYLTWRDRGLVTLDHFRALRHEVGTGEIRGGMGVSEVVPHAPEKTGSRPPKGPPLILGILIENADPIRSPAELPWWKERGIVAIGLAWAKSSRYAGGNSSRDGISTQGRELVAEMDRLGIVHDASHLSDRAFDELCELTDRPIVASHSNCRELLGDPGNQRHLSDAQIREIARRGGAIGLNLFSKFLAGSTAGPAARVLEAPRATIDDAIRHIDHVCELAGSRKHVGLGSDMDGGFAADRLPEGIDQPGDLHKLSDALLSAGWPVEDVGDFEHGNWTNFWSRPR